MRAEDHHGIRRLLALLVGLPIALVATASLAAQSPQAQTAPPEPPSTGELLELLPDERARLRIGLAELSADPDSPEARVAALTFPRLLYEELSGIDERELSSDELLAYARERIDEAIDVAASELRSAVAARDRLLFEPGDRTSDAAATRRAQADERVATARAELAALRNLNPALVPEEPVRPLDFWQGHAEGNLLAASEGDSPGTLADANDLDLVLWGVVEEIEGYLAIDVMLYVRVLDESRFLGGTVALPSEVGLDALAVAAEADEAVLGRPAARLDVVAPEEAAVTVNGALVGFGEVSVPYLRPGSLSLLVTAEGFAPVRRVFELGPGETRVERVSLEAQTARPVAIRSSPAGADVYADSVWVGRTPLTFDAPPAPTIVRLRLDGYLESRFVIDADSPPTVARALLPSTIDWSEELREERDDFYAALTLFVVSLPVTFLLRGGYLNIVAAYPPEGEGDLDPSEVRRLARLGNLFFWGSIGGILVNAGLAVNLGISISDYIEVGEGPHNQ